MNTDAESDLTALIETEKRRVAREIFQEAWSGAVAEGIEPAIVADSAISTVLSELACCEGEHSVSRLVTELPERLTFGDYRSDRRLQ